MVSTHVKRPSQKTASVPVTAGRVTRGAATTVKHLPDSWLSITGHMHFGVSRMFHSWRAP
jgi:hypothetical protein